MRFISPYAMFRKNVIHSVFDLTTNRPKSIGFTAMFEPGVFMDHERTAALTTWPHIMKRGSRMLDQALTMPAPLDHRIGVFDTSTIEDVELRKRIEKLMLEDRKYGRDYMMVEEPKVPAPWPAYDELVAQGRRSNEMVAAELVETARKIGADAGAVLRYERANRNRDEVIAAFEALLVPGGGEPERIEVGV